MSERSLLKLELRSGADVVLARRRARELAAAAGFLNQDQVRIATAVSEIARNAIEYGGSGRAAFSYVDSPRQGLSIEVDDNGPGFADLDAVLDGRYRSPHGLGIGVVGSRRLMDELVVRSQPGHGARVRMVKWLPPGAVPPAPTYLDPRAITSAEMADELKVADNQLVQALVELSGREEELLRVNRELEETNRGVLALYGELDERAISLKRAGELKTRFLSNMTHEFRTPVNSIIALAGMLLEELDGPLNAEQKKQVGFVRRAGQSLQELVNDLLDLAKVEAGKATVRPAPVSVTEVMATLRGMLRGPAAQNPAVQLVVEDPVDEIRLVTDEGKISQILRNLVSNALKFTETGEVRVTVAPRGDNRVIFTVTDTGMGIRPEDQPRIFQEFEQIEGPVQQRHRGTGLGLPLSRSLAQLLGGNLTLESALGCGSTFRLEIPRDYTQYQPTEPPVEPPQAGRLPVLVLQSDAATRRTIAEALSDAHTQIFVAATVAQARDHLARVAPALVVMDVLLEDENAWAFIEELRQGPSTQTTRIAVLTEVRNESKARALGANAFALKPAEAGWLREQRDAVTSGHKPHALVVDDDEIARYLTVSVLSSLGFRVEEATGGVEGLERARANPPAVIVLDLLMPDLTGFAVLDALSERPETRDIPVIMHTSATLSDDDRTRLARARSIVPKHSASRDEAALRLAEALGRAGLAVERPGSR